MILDGVLSDRRCWWLSPEADKRTFFDVTQETGLRPEEYPHITFASGSRKTVRCFPHDASVQGLDQLLNPARGEQAPHPFYLQDGGKREDMIAYLHNRQTTPHRPSR